MALVLDDRVQETTTTTGTGTVTLAGAVTGYQSFAAIGNGNTTYYCITDGTNWETGLGTYTSSGTTLARTTVLESSNSNNLVNFPAGSKNVFVTYPASQATLLDATQTLTNKTLTSPTITGAVVSSMASSVITAGTAVASTSGTSITFTGIPSWVKRITIMLNGVSGSGASEYLFQIGDSGGIENTGYLSTGSVFAAVVVSTAYTTGFGFPSGGSAAKIWQGAIRISNITGNKWVADGVFARSDTVNAAITAGGKTLSDVLTQVRLTHVNGTDTFDAGTVNILFE